ncbi:MAG: leucine-rich repeat domain-containing protein [Holosporales bacterium]|jgi:hypothetical protein|nr:leucine-rich repeat domain-containing protein [Holosporales bacterium]
MIVINLIKTLKSRSSKSSPRRMRQRNFDIVARSVLALAMLHFGAYASNETDLDIYNEKINNAVNLLDSTITLISDGPTGISDYVGTVSSNVERIKESITGSKDDVQDVFTKKDLFSYLVGVAFPEIEPYVSRALVYPTLPDLTTLVLINQSSISQNTIDNLGSFTSMVIVGNYAPAGLEYTSLTHLISLRMYHGNVNNVRSSVISLVNQKVLEYLEIPIWGSSSIAANAFKATSAAPNTKLRELVGFEDVTSIGNNAFQYCSGLNSMSFPKVSTAGGYAFNSCSSLTSLSLPLLTTAGDSAFCACTGLKTLDLPLLEEIGSYAFAYCRSLTSISVPNLTVDKTGYASFVEVPTGAIPSRFRTSTFT